MSKHDKNRQRLLVISATPTVRNDLVTLLTGYGYYVDYAKDRRDGLRSFLRHKQTIVIFDAATLPRFPERLFRLFKAYRHNPIILVAAARSEEPRAYQYLDRGVFDIVHLPLRVEYLHFVLRRLVQFNRLSASVFFLRILLIVLGLVIPVWLLFVHLLALP